MCGIVGAIAQRDVTPILLEGLKRLEYRGYDSAGVIVLDEQHQFNRLRRQGKVQSLVDALEQTNVSGWMGIAHTRWATHGVPSEQNAHPHLSHGDIAIVHNGIIENFAQLRDEILQEGYELVSETDTEIAAHCLYQAYQQTQGDCLQAIIRTIPRFKGSYSLGIIFRDHPEHIFAVRQGSPLVLGVGVGERFLASDPHALRSVTTDVIYLEDGDIADCSRNQHQIYNSQGEKVDRAVRVLQNQLDMAERGAYRHYMQKEIFEQPTAIRNTLAGRLANNLHINPIFSKKQLQGLAKVERIHIVACGTSYHAGLVARYWLEQLAGVPVTVDIASEYRYRDTVVEANTLFISISQSGETADTLAALRVSKERNYAHHLAICNVPESSLVRESDMIMMTAAGMEIGVASTKAFSTQLANLLLLALLLAEKRNKNTVLFQAGVQALKDLPAEIEQVLETDHHIAEIAELFANKKHALFLGRGIHYPIALEGALKLKEISYIHAEAYPAGELKHGPLALVDQDMPIVALAPHGHLLEKLKSNLEEVRARGGELFIFADKSSGFKPSEGITVLDYVSRHPLTSPIIHTIPLQLLAYHVAVRKGTDVDKPRNLAKSVTVE